MDKQRDNGDFGAWKATVWYSRSVMMKLMILVQMLAILLETAAVSTNFWTVRDGINLGLWSYLIHGSTADCGPEMTVMLPCLAVLSLLVLIGAFTVNLTLSHRRFHVIMPAVFIFTIVSGLLLLSVTVLWGMSHKVLAFRMSWSYYLAISAISLDLFAGLLTMREVLVTRRTQRAGYHAQAETLADEDSDEVYDL